MPDIFKMIPIAAGMRVPDIPMIICGGGGRVMFMNSAASVRFAGLVAGNDLIIRLHADDRAEFIKFADLSGITPLIKRSSAPLITIGFKARGAGSGCVYAIARRVRFGGESDAVAILFPDCPAGLLACAYRGALIGEYLPAGLRGRPELAGGYGDRLQSAYGYLAAADEYYYALFGECFLPCFLTHIPKYRLWHISELFGFLLDELDCHRILRGCGITAFVPAQSCYPEYVYADRRQFTTAIISALYCAMCFHGNDSKTADKTGGIYRRNMSGGGNGGIKRRNISGGLSGYNPVSDYFPAEILPGRATHIIAHNEINRLSIDIITEIPPESASEIVKLGMFRTAVSPLCTVCMNLCRDLSARMSSEFKGVVEYADNRAFLRLRCYTRSLDPSLAGLKAFSSNEE